MSIIRAQYKIIHKHGLGIFNGISKYVIILVYSRSVRTITSTCIKHHANQSLNHNPPYVEILIKKTGYHAEHQFGVAMKLVLYLTGTDCGGSVVWAHPKRWGYRIRLASLISYHRKTMPYKQSTWHSIFTCNTGNLRENYSADNYDAAFIYIISMVFRLLKLFLLNSEVCENESTMKKFTPTFSRILFHRE